MGWNTLDMVGEHPVLERLPLGPKGLHGYFVHSYHLNASNEADVLLRADYGRTGSRQWWLRTPRSARSFIPRRASALVSALISNFLKWKP